MKKRILVIGSSGFIGTALCDQLLLQNYHVTGADINNIPESSALDRFVEADFRNDAIMEPLIKESDCIFHLSSTTIPAVSNKFPMRDIEENLKGTLNLLELLRKYPDKKLIFISSGGTVYGEARFLPIRESHETNPVCSYGVVKLAIEKYIQMYSRLYGIKHLIYRLSNPYGPKQLNRNGQGLIASLILRINNQAPIDIWGDGSIVRDYLYIDDAINALVAGVEYDGLENLFNLSSGKGYSTREIISFIENILQKPAIINYKKARDFDVQENVLDIQRLKQYMNWQPEIDIESGINKTIAGKSSMERYYCDYMSG